MEELPKFSTGTDSLRIFFTLWSNQSQEDLKIQETNGDDTKDRMNKLNGARWVDPFPVLFR